MPLLDRQQAFAQLGTRFTASAGDFSAESFPQHKSQAVLESLITEIAAGQAACWDRVVQFQLALAAFVADRDMEDAKYSNLQVHSKQLAKYLAGRFGGRPVSIYSSPAKFDPADAELLSHLQAISIDLKSIR